MGSLRSWVAASRPGQALLAPSGVGVGVAYAHFDAQRWPGFTAYVLVSVAAAAAALGVNLLDHAWERWAAPPIDSKERKPDALLPVDAGSAAAAAVVALVLGVLCGFGLVRLSGSAALGYGVLAVMLGAVRGAPLVGLDTLGWGLGELATAVALGPLAVLAGFASQAGTGSEGAFLVGLPAGLVALAALFGWRVRSAGVAATDARRIAAALPLFAAGAVAIAVRAGEYGPWANAAALPMAIAAVAAWRRPATPADADHERWQWLAVACSVAALAAIAAAFLIGPAA